LSTLCRLFVFWLWFLKQNYTRKLPNSISLARRPLLFPPIRLFSFTPAVQATNSNLVPLLHFWENLLHPWQLGSILADVEGQLGRQILSSAHICGRKCPHTTPHTLWRRLSTFLSTKPRGALKCQVPYVFSLAFLSGLFNRDITWCKHLACRCFLCVAKWPEAPVDWRLADCHMHLNKPQQWQEDRDNLRAHHGLSAWWCNSTHSPEGGWTCHAVSPPWVQPPGWHLHVQSWSVSLAEPVGVLVLGAMFPKVHELSSHQPTVQKDPTGEGMLVPLNRVTQRAMDGFCSEWTWLSPHMWLCIGQRCDTETLFSWVTLKVDRVRVRCVCMWHCVSSVSGVCPCGVCDVCDVVCVACVCDVCVLTRLCSVSAWCV
jgi:hypothetical protein